MTGLRKVQIVDPVREKVRKRGEGVYDFAALSAFDPKS
jgi:hypothetical protein